MTKSKKTAADAAKWMADQIAKHGELYQADAADHLQLNFGSKFADTNDSGGMSITREVLAEFRKLTAKTVVWERSERYWRRRTSFDGRGRLVE